MIESVVVQLCSKREGFRLKTEITTSLCRSLKAAIVILKYKILSNLL